MGPLTMVAAVRESEEDTMMYPSKISDVPPRTQFEMAGQIETELLRSVAEVNTQTTNEQIAQPARDADGRLVGGARVATSYGLLLVKLVWVVDSHRGTGLARADGRSRSPWQGGGMPFGVARHIECSGVRFLPMAGI